MSVEKNSPYLWITERKEGKGRERKNIFLMDKNMRTYGIIHMAKLLPV